MNSKTVLNIILLLGLLSCTQNAPSVDLRTTDQETPNGIQIGIKETVHSDILDQDRTIAIYLPDSFNNPDRKREKYPVVYLLDGSYPFVPFVGMLKVYSEMNDTKILPEMIVVAIDNIDFKSRMMDFSPTTSGNPEQYGGGDKFLNFIGKELFPFIEENYNGAQQRTIVGHSFGGVAVMNALTNHSEMFDNYLMIDGSLYFDNELFFNDSKYSLRGKNLEDKNLFIGIANTATYGSDLESIKNDTITANKYVRHSLKLIDQIENSGSNLNLKWNYYGNETHGSSALPSYIDGFRYFYSWFEFKEEHKYRSKYFIPETDNDRFANLTRHHFKNVSNQLGYQYLPREDWVSGYAGSLIGFQNQPKQARETYILNTEFYPNSSGVYKDLGDFYLSQNDTIKAKINYNKTLEIENNPSVRELLNKFK